MIPDYEKMNKDNVERRNSLQTEVAEIGKGIGKKLSFQTKKDPTIASNFTNIGSIIVSDINNTNLNSRLTYSEYSLSKNTALLGEDINYNNTVDSSNDKTLNLSSQILLGEGNKKINYGGYAGLSSNTEKINPFVGITGGIDTSIVKVNSFLERDQEGYMTTGISGDIPIGKGELNIYGEVGGVYTVEKSINYGANYNQPILQDKGTVYSGVSLVNNIPTINAGIKVNL